MIVLSDIIYLPVTLDNVPWKKTTLQKCMNLIRDAVISRDRIRISWITFRMNDANPAFDQIIFFLIDIVHSNTVTVI